MNVRGQKSELHLKANHGVSVSTLNVIRLEKGNEIM